VSGPVVVVDLATLRLLSDLGEVYEKRHQDVYDQTYQMVELKVTIGERVYSYYEEGWKIDG
jgi:hypothetical protein